MNCQVVCTRSLHTRDLRSSEGIIRPNPWGEELSNETGGCCRNKRTVRGFFTPVPVFDYLKKVLKGNCNANEEEIRLINEYFEEVGWPYEAVCGEESWLHLKGPGEHRYILTWPNSKGV